MLQGVKLAKTHSLSWSDWFGCVFFVCFCAFLLIRAPRIGLLMLPTVAHDLLMAASFLLRRAPKARLREAGPRLAAYAATFIVPVFMIGATAYRPAWLRLSQSSTLLRLGLGFWLAGIPLVLFGLWQLRRSFSIEPQARQLVTTGPYLLARHPIYTGYLLQYFGFMLARPTPAFVAVVIAWFGLLLLRTHYEERVLGSAFPEYAIYRKRVGMFGPRLRIPTTTLNRLGSEPQIIPSR